MGRRREIGLIVVAALVGLCGVSLWYTFKEDYGVGVASVWWLPPEAHNITYMRNDAIRLAEFDIEQEAFEEWCTGRKTPLRKLGDAEHPMVDRCVAVLEKRGVLPTNAEPNGAVEGHSIKQFAAGDLFYAERWSNGGGYRIGYDVKERRGYYEYLHH